MLSPVVTMSQQIKRKFDTLAVHPKGHAEFDSKTGAVIPPISLSTTFAQFEPAKPIGVQIKSYDCLIFNYHRNTNILGLIIQVEDYLKNP